MLPLKTGRTTQEAILELLGLHRRRDGAEAIKLALEKDLKGHHAFIIATTITVMKKPSAELVKEVFREWSTSR